MYCTTLINRIRYQNGRTSSDWNSSGLRTVVLVNQGPIFKFMHGNILTPCEIDYLRLYRLYRAVYRAVSKRWPTALSPATQVTCAVYFFVISKKYLSIQSKYAKLMQIPRPKWSVPAVPCSVHCRYTAAYAVYLQCRLLIHC